MTAAAVTCFQVAHGGDNFAKTSDVLSASDIVYKEVNVTSIKKQTTDKTKGPDKGPKTTTSAKPSSTTTSSGGIPTLTAGPLAMMGGAVGAGLLALAAL